MLRGGAIHFFRKRAHRILPPYYMALCLGILCGFFDTPPGSRLAFLNNPLTKKAIFQHIVLIHNWSSQTFAMLDGPLWSVAMEVQIYLLFPILVLVWRRFGVGWMLVFSFVVGHAVYFGTRHVVTANYLFEFALGMWAASLCLQRRWTNILCAVSILSLLCLRFVPGNIFSLTDAFVGCAVAALLAICARPEMVLRRVFEVKFIVWLGTFSYSIYLIHGPLQELFLAEAGRFHFPVSGWHTFLWLSLAGTSVILGLANVFYWLFERPFLNRRPPLNAPGSNTLKEVAANAVGV